MGALDYRYSELLIMLVSATFIHGDPYPRPGEGRFACCGGWGLVLDTSQLVSLVVHDDAWHTEGNQGLNYSPSSFVTTAPTRALSAHSGSFDTSLDDCRICCRRSSALRDSS